MTPALSYALNQALTIVVIAAIPVLVSYAILGLNKLRALAESKLTAAQLAAAKSVAAEAVQAAEVFGASTYVQDKEAWATNWASDYLKSKGITIDVTSMVGLIRSAYLTQINASNTLPTIKAAANRQKLADTVTTVVNNVAAPVAPDPVAAVAQALNKMPVVASAPTAPESSPASMAVPAAPVPDTLPPAG